MSANKTTQMTLKELAELLQGTLKGDPHHQISGVADLDTATESDAAFVTNARYENKMAASKAGVILVTPQTKKNDHQNVIVCDNPAKAFEILVQTFIDTNQKRSGFNAIHPTAVIHPTAKVHPTATLHPYVVIDAHAVVGKESVIGAHTYVGPFVTIGEQCYVHPRVTLLSCITIGDRTILHSGVAVGEDGFGYTQTLQGHVRVPHYGSVAIGSDVEIGANTTVACARFQSTTIGDGTKIDAHVLIAHNVRIGRYVLIVGHTAIAGSTTIGDGVVVGGKVAIDGHLEIKSGVMIRSWSGVTKSIDKPGVYGGMPAQPIAKERRHNVYLRRLEELFKRVERLEEQA